MKPLLLVLAALFVSAPFAADATTVDDFTLISNNDGSVLTFQLAGSPTTATKTPGGLSWMKSPPAPDSATSCSSTRAAAASLTVDDSGLSHGPNCFSGTAANRTSLLNTFSAYPTILT